MRLGAHVIRDVAETRLKRTALPLPPVDYLFHVDEPHRRVGNAFGGIREALRKVRLASLSGDNVSQEPILLAEAIGVDAVHLPQCFSIAIKIRH